MEGGRILVREGGEGESTHSTRNHHSNSLTTNHHRGILSVISDYVPQSMQGFCRFLLYGVTAGAFVGLMYLNFNDVGICRAVRMVWSL